MTLPYYYLYFHLYFPGSGPLHRKDSQARRTVRHVPDSPAAQLQARVQRGGRPPVHRLQPVHQQDVLKVHIGP